MVKFSPGVAPHDRPPVRGRHLPHSLPVEKENGRNHHPPRKLKSTTVMTTTGGSTSSNNNTVVTVDNTVSSSPRVRTTEPGAVRSTGGAAHRLVSSFGSAHRRRTHPAPPSLLVAATLKQPPPPPPPAEIATSPPPPSHHDESFATSSTCSNNSFLEESMMDAFLQLSTNTSPTASMLDAARTSCGSPADRPDCRNPVAWTLLYRDGREDDSEFLQQQQQTSPAMKSACPSPTLVRALPPSNLTRPQPRRISPQHLSSPSVLL